MNKKEAKDQVAQARKIIKNEEIFVFELYPIGSEINVLGSRMSIVEHVKFFSPLPSSPRVPPPPPVKSGIRCIYSCKAGIIQRVTFSMKEIKILFKPEARVR